MSKEFGGPIGQKYARIDIAGRQALKQEGAIKELEGFGETLKNRFLVAIQFAPESRQEVQKRVINEVEQIEVNCKMEFFLTNRDFPLHSTIEEGVYQGDDDSIKGEVFAEMAKELKQLNWQMLNEPLTYKYVLIDKGNIILTAIEIPDVVTKLRRELTTFYTAHQLKPLPIEHILHVTVGRITRLPGEHEEEALEKYKRRMIQLRHDIAKNPLKLSIGEMFAGSSYDFLHSLQIKKDSSITQL